MKGYGKILLTIVLSMLVISTNLPAALAIEEQSDEKPTAPSKRNKDEIKIKNVVTFSLDIYKKIRRFLFWKKVVWVKELTAKPDLEVIEKNVVITVPDINKVEKKTIKVYINWEINDERDYHGNYELVLKVKNENNFLDTKTLSVQKVRQGSGSIHLSGSVEIFSKTIHPTSGEWYEFKIIPKVEGLDLDKSTTVTIKIHVSVKEDRDSKSAHVAIIDPSPKIPRKIVIADFFKEIVKAMVAKRLSRILSLFK